MVKSFLFDIILLIILFIGNIIICNYNYYFILIYLFILLYNIYIFYLLLKKQWNKKYKIILFIINSIILYPFTYFIICDPNPILFLLTYYIFFPNFFKAILIILIHSFIFSRYIKKKEIIFSINLEKSPFKLQIIESDIKNLNKLRNRTSFFLSNIIKFFTRNKFMLLIFLLIISLFLAIDILLFYYRIKLWVYLNSKKKTLPISSSKNTTFYITAIVANIENIIIIYIEQMKKLINYLEEKNVIISIVENGDSRDNTRKYLKEFQNYLNNKKIINRFILRHEVDDPRRKIIPFKKYSPLRIEFYSKLRNKCFDLLYDLKNIDFNNTIIIFFNDVVFEYEDIINLLSTNNEDYDAVCALDVIKSNFYDRWVSIDLDGNSLSSFFPFFINKEAQDLILNHKPVRVFSCWNGVIAFKALPLKNKKIQFRYKNNEKPPQYSINNAVKANYESECTYFHIDLFDLGYSKKFINPDVIVDYQFNNNKIKFFHPSKKEILNYVNLYLKSLKIKRNKMMSNYKDKNIKFNKMLENWYIENKKN